MVRAELIDGDDTIALETDAEVFTDVLAKKRFDSISSLMRTRRGRIVVWVLTAPGMDLFKANEGNRVKLSYREDGRAQKNGGNASSLNDPAAKVSASTSKSSALLSTFAQLLCTSSLPGIPLHALRVELGGVDFASLRASRGFQSPSSDADLLTHKLAARISRSVHAEFASGAAQSKQSMASCESGVASMFAQTDMLHRIDRKVLDFTCSYLCWWQHVGHSQTLRNSMHQGEQSEIALALIAFFFECPGRYSGQPNKPRWR
jgi:hypothetical protein